VPKNNRAYKSAKRSREISRQQKKEEKRKKRLEREKAGVEGDIQPPAGEDAPVVAPAETD
jgi:hypothetical protein